MVGKLHYIIYKVPNQNGRIFSIGTKRFSRVTQNAETIFRKETYSSHRTSISVAVKVGSFLYYISDEGRYRKTVTTVK